MSDAIKCFKLVTGREALASFAKLLYLVAIMLQNHYIASWFSSDLEQRKVSKHIS